MLDGVMLLWFLLTAAALLFVAIDIRNTPGTLPVPPRHPAGPRSAHGMLDGRSTGSVQPGGVGFAPRLSL